MSRSSRSSYDSSMAMAVFVRTGLPTRSLRPSTSIALLIAQWSSSSSHIRPTSVPHPSPTLAHQLSTSFCVVLPLHVPSPRDSAWVIPENPRPPTWRQHRRQRRQAAIHGGIIDEINAAGSDAKVDRLLAMWCLPRRLSPRTTGCINSPLQ
ncbi:hypothetical protein C8R47DRAFT_644394 [Mycena vitilis]|nr:hypothetical protein C8R47DRAFT_644394 [Mycena vitilis]